MAEPGGALFGEVKEKRIRRGSFKSEEEPERAIEGCQRLQNAKPKPFVWTKDADLIVRKVKKACDRLAPPVNQKRTSDSGRYEVNYVRKYYLLVQGSDRKIVIGFLMAPPGLADQLADHMSRTRNYSVNLTCKVERVRINTFAQWHGIVTRVDFVDGDGKVVKTIKQGK